MPRPARPAPAPPPSPAPSPPPSLPAAAVEASLGLLCLLRSELRERRPAGLTMAQFRLLHLAHREPDRSLADIADDLGVSPPAVTKMADVLAERGLVSREAAAGDRRRLRLALTREGREVVRQARKALEARVGERLAGLSAAEAAEVARGLQVLGACLAVPEAAA